MIVIFYTIHNGLKVNSFLKQYNFRPLCLKFRFKGWFTFIDYSCKILRHPKKKIEALFVFLVKYF